MRHTSLRQTPFLHPGEGGEAIYTMSRICAVCGKKIPLFKIKIKDGYICGPCQNRMPLNDIMRKEELTGEEVRRIIEEGEKRDNAKPDLFQQAMQKMQKSDDDKFEQVRKYRELYEEGIITEEEYERKRKELLDL